MQVSREGDICIYRQKHLHGPAERFEVIIVQHLQEHRFPNGRVQEAGEWYPRSSQWGQAGWTCFTLAEAQAHAKTVLEQHREDSHGQ
jgi:hypothetical protein